MDKLVQEAEEALKLARTKRLQVEEMRERELVLFGMALASPQMAATIMSMDEAPYGVSARTRQLLQAIVDKNRVAVSNALLELGVTMQQNSVMSMVEDIRRRGKVERLKGMIEKIANYNPLVGSHTTESLIRSLSEEIEKEREAIHEAHEQQASQQGRGVQANTPSTDRQGTGVHDLPSEPQQANSEQATGA